MTDGKSSRPTSRSLMTQPVSRIRSSEVFSVSASCVCSMRTAASLSYGTITPPIIMMMGGVIVPYDKLAAVRMEHTQLAETLKTSLDRILETGCVIKDLEVGLLDFPSVIGNEEVYLCWKLGEDRIRFYHRQDEGFAGRKPLDPRDLAPGDTVQ